MYIFIDPGESTGWAIFDDNGEQEAWGTTRGFDGLSFWLTVNILPETSNLIKRVVVEDFKLYPWKAQAQMWSQFTTVQVIGAIKHHCLGMNIPFELVPANNKNMGFMYQGIKEPPHSNPLNHQMVAAAHGVFWLTNKGIRKHKAR